MFSLAQQNGSEQITVPLSRPGEQGVLSISHYKGTIRVIGYDGQRVVVQASLRYDDKKDSESGLRQLSSNDLKLSSTEKQNTVTITANSGERTVDLVIYVPHVFSLRVQKSDHGDITVQGVQGEMEITNANGHIELLNVGGSVLLSTVDGNIRVLFDNVTEDVPMVFSSIEGTIDVTFPPSVKAYIKMKSDYGDIFSDFNLNLEKRKPQIEKSEKDGLYKVFLEDWMYGTVNGGGPEFLFTTVHGNIYFRMQH